MGIFDNIKKAVNIAQDLLDDGKLNGSSEGAPLPKVVQKAQDTVSGNVKKTPRRVLMSGNEPIGEVREVINQYAEVVSSFKLPVSFTEFDSNAEPEMCHVYMFDDEDLKNGINFCKPIICITPENFAYHAVQNFYESGLPIGVNRYEIVEGCSKMLFKAWLDDHHGQALCFYGFRRGESGSDYMGLAMIYCKDVIGTPLEKKLELILDLAARTYKEK